MKYEVRVFGKKITQIIVQCPKCGKTGRLIVAKRRSFNGIAAFRIMHGSSTDSRNSCIVSLTHEKFEELLKIYYKVRGNGK
jgi:ssDNA-binding Zn-finger/Zn-ribbon topoisomerase 1